MSIFEDVKAHLNIREVVEHYGFRVNRAGKFTCPFHNDHSPSASIKDDYFHCFVCGAGGDLITFTAKYLGMSNIDATRELVRVFGLNIDISTKEERKARYEAERKARAEVRACSGLRDKYYKDKAIRSEQKRRTDYRLRNAIRESDRRKEAEQEAYIRHVGLVLADIHRLLWHGIHLYPYGDERHIWGLQELTTCEYYIDCYDENPKQFVSECGKAVERYERELVEYRRKYGQ